MRIAMPKPRSSRGFTFLGLMIFITVAATAIAATIQVWHTSMQREKEVELLFIGNEFRKALAAYSEGWSNNVIGTPVQRGQAPPTLDVLLKDDRFLSTQRWLRKVYVDPMTGKAEWGFVKNGTGQITGIYSLSEEVPLKKKGFLSRDAGFENAKRYSDWIFATVTLPASGAKGTIPNKTTLPSVH